MTTTTSRMTAQEIHEYISHIIQSALAKTDHLKSTLAGKRRSEVYEYEVEENGDWPAAHVTCRYSKKKLPKIDNVEGGIIDTIDIKLPHATSILLSRFDGGGICLTFVRLAHFMMTVPLSNLKKDVTDPRVQMLVLMWENRETIMGEL